MMMETVAAALLFLASCVCTVRTRFVQFRRLGQSIRGLTAWGAAKDSVSPFAASATSLAATLGTGNIAGVAGAIAIGGPGAVFWMWMSALAGMGAKYLDIYYGLRYRRHDCVGPMAYMEDALCTRLSFMPFLYAALCALACLCMGNLVQINAMSEAAVMLADMFGAARLARWLPAILGVTGAAFVGAVQLGGAKRVGETASLIVPAMSALYIGAALVVLIANARRLPAALLSIFECAMQPRAIMIGIARGTFSHEAGLGTAAIAHTGAKTTNAHRQALFGVFEVFFDTIVMCTITALAVLSAMPERLIAESVGQNSVIVIEAFATVLGGPAAAWCVTASLILFALTSALSFAYYGTVCARYLFGEKGEKRYRMLYLLLMCAGGVVRAASIWRLAQWVNIAMGMVNMGALLLAAGGTRAKAVRSNTG